MQIRPGSSVRPAAPLNPESLTVSRPAEPASLPAAEPREGFVQVQPTSCFGLPRAAATAEQAHEQGIAMKEARRTARAERVAPSSGADPSIKERVRGLLDVLKGVGPASVQVADAFRHMLDGKALKLPDWQGEVRDILLGPAYPTAPQAIAAEDQRIDAALAGPMARLSPQKAGIFEQMRGMGLSDTDIFRGSHVVASDGGALYDEWKALGARPRTSSHYPGLQTQQLEIEFPGMGVMLFGKDKSNQTWFQMEAHSTRPEEAVAHMFDYVKHQVSGHQNIGPMGYSPHSEKLGQELRVRYDLQPALS